MELRSSGLRQSLSKCIALRIEAVDRDDDRTPERIEHGDADGADPAVVLPEVERPSPPPCCWAACAASLLELCRVMGLPGKPDGISGAEVERYWPSPK
jgi:hypothetical protein